MAQAKKPLAVRVAAGTLQHLQRRAHETRETQTALVERYVEEGLRTDEHPLIYFRAGAAGRRPALIGTRLDVWQVIDSVRENGNSVEDAADYLGLADEKIRACVRYYADYKDEIDGWTARAHAIADREEANWQRQQELLA